MEKLTVTPQELNGLSATILHQGKCIAIIGKNGIGKSTWFQKIITEIHWVQNFGSPYFISQNWTVPDMPVWHLVEMMMALNLTDYTEHLNKWNLQQYEYQSLKTLSGGELQRLRLSFLDNNKALWWLLDEPFIGLDEYHQLQFLQYLEFMKGVKTIFFITHDIDFILKHKPLLIDLIIEIIEIYD